MAIAVVKLQDDFSGPAATVAKSSGRMRDSMGQFAKSAQGIGPAMTGAAGKMSAFDKSTTKLGKGISNLDFSGLTSWFTHGLAGGQSMTSMFTGLAGAIDPVSLALKVGTLELEVFAAAAAGVVVGLAGMMLTAIGVNEKAREMNTRLQALTGDAKGTTAMIDALAASMAGAFTPGQLKTFAASLAAAGYQGEALKSAIEAVASATALMGAEGGAAAQTLLSKIQELSSTGQKLSLNARTLKQLAEMGISAQDLATQLHKPVDELKNVSLAGKDAQAAIEAILKAKGAEALKDKAISLSAISAAFGANISEIFKGLDSEIKPFMTELKNLVGTFGKGTGGSSLLASAVKAILVPAFRIATVALKAIHSGEALLINWFLRAAIAWKKFTGATLAGSIVRGIIMVIVAAAAICVTTIGILAAGFAALMIPVIAVAGALALVPIAFMAVMAGAKKLGAAVGSAISGVVAVLAGWAGQAYAAASNFIQGLVQGIMAGAGAVIGAVSSLASGAVGAFKGALGIHSKSTVMMKMGGFINQGLSHGMANDNGAVAGAAQDMAGGVVAGASGGGAKASGCGKGGGGVTINIQPGAVVIQGAGSSGEALTLTEDALALLLERVALARGLAA